MENKINEVTIEMDANTLAKERGHLKPTDTVKLTPDTSTTSTVASMTPVTEEDAVIEPQDKATIKYLSNVKDNKTGEISKPFTISGKNYQMVRGITPSREIVMAVYCHDDMDEAGNNIIHPIEYFEENIAKKAMNEEGFDYASQERDFHDKENIKTLPKTEPKTPNTDFDYAAAERNHNDKQNLGTEAVKPNNSLQLSEFKHFLVDKKTGKVRKFKRAEELAKAKMSDNESYMNLGQFKKHVDEALFGLKQKNKITEVGPDSPQVPDKPDVQMAINQMVLKMKPYMDKINESIEKIQFIVKLTSMLQLESSKYPLLFAALKKNSNATFGGSNTNSGTAQASQSTTPVTERKVITKNQLIDSVKGRVLIKTIKVKDIK